MAKEFPLSVSRWRKRATRTNDIKKLNPEICPKILFEYVAREFREMGRLIEMMPQVHKKLLLQTYRSAMGKEKKCPSLIGIDGL